jgi:hypothetical protein
METFRQMADVLERVWEGQQQSQQQLLRPRQPFKTPEFSGTTDVEYFMTQFTEVADANGWSLTASLLHLREALKEGSKDCGRANSITGVFSALRARYGLSPKEARSKLNALYKDVRGTLQEHASEVERLSQISYADLPPRQRDELALEAFCSTLGNLPLQRHLLAVQAQTMEQAVRAGNEYLQVKTSGASAIRTVADNDTDDQIAAVQPSLMGTLIQLMQQLTEKVDRMQIGTYGSNKPRPSEKGSGCWGCGQEGHTRRTCRTNPWPTKPATTSQPQGNDASPQQ